VAWLALAGCLGLACSSAPDKPPQGTGGSPGNTGGSSSGGSGNATGGMGGSAGGAQTCVPFADVNSPVQKLSQTGCVDPANPKTLAASVIPYEVNSPLWSDGADKSRGMALPAGAKIHVVNCTATPSDCPGSNDKADDGKWKFPVGTVMVKNFLFDGKFLETRLFMRFNATTWAGFTYKWDEAQTDATLVSPDREEVSFSTGQRTVDWHYPSRMDCMTCHIPDRGYAILGPETAQMNRVVSGSNQLDKLQAMGLFDAPIPTPYKPALIQPTTSSLGSPPASASAEQRATTYLHANCAFCHRSNPEDVDCTTDPCLDLRFGLPLAQRNICNVTPAKGGFALTNPVTLAPGHPENSVLSLRMKQPPDDSTGHHGRMPQIASYVVDQEAAAAIDAWITSITSCPQ
jgi:uncharacterized repeat protein (TIGR03806 family)